MIDVRKDDRCMAPGCNKWVTFKWLHTLLTGHRDWKFDRRA